MSQEEAAPPLPVEAPAVWYVVRAEGQEPYYYHSETLEVTWTPPPGARVLNPEDLGPAPAAAAEEGCLEDTEVSDIEKRWERQKFHNTQTNAEDAREKTTTPLSLEDPEGVLNGQLLQCDEDKIKHRLSRLALGGMHGTIAHQGGSQLPLGTPFQTSSMEQTSALRGVAPGNGRADKYHGQHRAHPGWEMTQMVDGSDLPPTIDNSREGSDFEDMPPPPPPPESLLPHGWTDHQGNFIARDGHRDISPISGTMTPHTMEVRAYKDQGSGPYEHQPDSYTRSQRSGSESTSASKAQEKPQFHISPKFHIPAVPAPLKAKGFKDKKDQKSYPLHKVRGLDKHVNRAEAGRNRQTNAPKLSEYAETGISNSALILRDDDEPSERGWNSSTTPAITVSDAPLQPKYLKKMHPVPKYDHIKKPPHLRYGKISRMLAEQS